MSSAKSSSSSPIFVVGHSRSGSTLLSTLLGRHQNIKSLPETHFFGGSYAGFFLKRMRAAGDVDRLVDYTLGRNVRIKDVGLDEVAIAARLKGARKLSPKAVLDAIFASELDASVKQRILEKTPFHIEHMDRILKWYPDAKIICILRDPRDAIDSLLKASWTHSDARRHALYWEWCVREATRQARHRPENVAMVRYEDLVTDPSATLAGLLDFLGEEGPVSALELADDAGTIPEWEKEWKAKSAAQIDPEWAFKWQKNPRPDHALWSSWTAHGRAALDYPGSNQPGARNDVFERVALEARRAAYLVLYDVWRVFRTHISRRKNRFRAIQVIPGRGEA